MRLSTASAASLVLSLRLGCAWQMRAMSSLLAFQNKDLQDARNYIGQLATALTMRVNTQQALGGGSFRSGGRCCRQVFIH